MTARRLQREARLTAAYQDRIAELESALRGLLDTMESPRSSKAAVVWDKARKVAQ